MCGICGVVTSGDPEHLEDMVQAMNTAGRHRGPDDEGVVTLSLGIDRATDSWTALGHTRLSIIDLSRTGHQPMADSERRFWIVFNGEIYNYVELRDELRSKGHHFRSDSDTEVILAAWRQWGVGSLNRFNGMWAFAIVDTKEKEIVLARDRFGVKPLHYIRRPGFFSFASEIKQLLAGATGRPTLNREIAADFFFWGYQYHTDNTFIEEIKSLPGGHLLRMTPAELRAGHCEVTEYWRPEPEASCNGISPSQRFLELFSDAVRLRLRSDVPVGLTLSGGLDSSSIACIASRHRREIGGQEPLKAFTAIYDDRGYSEAEFAQMVVEKAGLDSIQVRPSTTQLVKDWSEFVRCMDEPFGGLSYYSNWKIYQQIRAWSVPVILNGQGGDELLLGYERYRVPFLRFLWKAGRLGDFFREVFWIGRRSGLSLGILAAYSCYFSVPELRIQRRLRLLRPYVTNDFLQLGRRRAKVVHDAGTHECLAELVLKEFGRYQLPHLLQHEDRVSMHFAVESRNPFLDYRLLNFVLGHGIDVLIHDGWSKYVLRESMAGILPERIRTRTDKMGFNTPTNRLFSDETKYFSEIFDRNTSNPMLNIAALKKGFLSGHLNPNLLCSVLSYLEWTNEYQVVM